MTVRQQLLVLAPHRQVHRRPQHRVEKSPQCCTLGPDGFIYQTSRLAIIIAKLDGKRAQIEHRLFFLQSCLKQVRLRHSYRVLNCLKCRWHQPVAFASPIFHSERQYLILQSVCLACLIFYEIACVASLVLLINFY